MTTRNPCQLDLRHENLIQRRNTTVESYNLPRVEANSTTSSANFSRTYCTHILKRRQRISMTHPLTYLQFSPTDHCILTNSRRVTQGAPLFHLSIDTEEVYTIIGLETYLKAIISERIRLNTRH